VVPIPQLACVYNAKRLALAPFGHHELLVGAAQVRSFHEFSTVHFVMFFWFFAADIIR
jgi:hypothetical protein